MIYSQHPVRYYVYILLCYDKSYYTGLTDDLGRRLMEHEEGKYPDCYTYRRRPIQLMYFETIVLLDDALKRGEQIKKWSRAKKKALIQSNYDFSTALEVVLRPLDCARGWFTSSTPRFARDWLIDQSPFSGR